MEDFWTVTIVVHPYGAGVWRTIRNLRPKIISNSKIKVGNGGKTLFWEDIWVVNQIFKSRFPVLYNLNLKRMPPVKEVRDNIGSNFRFRRHS